MEANLWLTVLLYGDIVYSSAKSKSVSSPTALRTNPVLSGMNGKMVVESSGLSEPWFDKLKNKDNMFLKYL